jgi:hypothetical protein
MSTPTPVMTPANTSGGNMNTTNMNKPANTSGGNMNKPANTAKPMNKNM